MSGMWKNGESKKRAKVGSSSLAGSILSSRSLSLSLSLCPSFCVALPFFLLGLFCCWSFSLLSLPQHTFPKALVSLARPSLPTTSSGVTPAADGPPAAAPILRTERLDRKTVSRQFRRFHIFYPTVWSSMTPPSPPGLRCKTFLFSLSLLSFPLALLFLHCVKYYDHYYYYKLPFFPTSRPIFSAWVVWMQRDFLSHESVLHWKKKIGQTNRHTNTEASPQKNVHTVYTYIHILKRLKVCCAGKQREPSPRIALQQPPHHLVGCSQNLTTLFFYKLQSEPNAFLWTHTHTKKKKKNFRWKKCNIIGWKRWLITVVCLMMNDHQLIARLHALDWYRKNAYESNRSLTPPISKSHLKFNWLPSFPS